MKYVILIGDGMADYPIPERDGKTALQLAYTPNLDFIATAGMCSRVKTIPEGMDAGSDIAILSILGYDPAKYYTGRGPLEAMGMHIPLDEGDIAFRCNLITEKEGRIEDYS
jgi:2,3-bisphosphoglycerate-independent phosphoglycerate mutase